MAVGVTSVIGRLRRATFLANQVTDGLVVLAVCAVVLAISCSPYVAQMPDLAAGKYALTLATAAMGTAAALAALVASRLFDDPRPSWFGAALLLYGLVVLPVSALMDGPLRPATNLMAGIAMLSIALVIMLVGLRPPRRLGAWGGWVLLAFGLGLGALLNAAPRSALADMLAAGPLAPLVALVGWAIVAVAFLLDGYRRQNRVQARLGLGLVVIALSQLHRLLELGLPASDLAYPALRALGMTVVLVGMLQLVLRRVTAMQTDFDMQEEELGRATLHLERATLLAAERDHELRNGLAGLAGAAHVLSSRDGGEQGARVREALLAELTRLRQLLETPLDAADDDGWGGPATNGPRPVADGVDDAGHPLATVLETLVAVRVDEPITLARSDADLRTVVAPSVTTHIVSNLLANCARHAPGAPVCVRATGGVDTVTVEVRDAGPGLPEGTEARVFERGMHDGAAGGSGLGLHISRRMAEENGATLQVRTVHDPLGCLAVLTLPSAHD